MCTGIVSCPLANAPKPGQLVLVSTAKNFASQPEITPRRRDKRNFSVWDLGLIWSQGIPEVPHTGMHPGSAASLPLSSAGGWSDRQEDSRYQGFTDPISSDHATDFKVDEKQLQITARSPETE